jgi:hypothetical protein
MSSLSVTADKSFVILSPATLDISCSWDKILIKE